MDIGGFAGGQKSKQLQEKRSNTMEQKEKGEIIERVEKKERRVEKGGKGEQRKE